MPRPPLMKPQQRQPHSRGQTLLPPFLRDPEPCHDPRQLRGPFPLPGLGGQRDASRGQLPLASAAVPRGGWRRPGCGAEASRWKYFAPDALRFPGNRRQGFLVLSGAGTGARRAPFARPLRGSGQARCHRHRRLHRASPSPLWLLRTRGSTAAPQRLPQAALYPSTEPDCLGQPLGHEEGDGTPRKAFLCSPSCRRRDSTNTPGERGCWGLTLSPPCWPVPCPSLGTSPGAGGHQSPREVGQSWL